MSTLITTTAQIGTIKDAGGSNTGMTVSSAGHVIMPNRPAFACHLESTVALDGNNGWGATSGSSSLSSGAWDWNITHGGYNVGGHWSDTNNRFTAPIAGLYSFTFSIVMAGAGNNVTFRLQNSDRHSRYAGANFVGGTNSTSSNTTAQFSLDASDYVTIEVGYARTNSVEGDSGGFGRTWWSGYLIG